MSYVAAAGGCSNLRMAILTSLMVSACGCSVHDSRSPARFDIVGSRFLGSAWNEGHAQASVVSQDGGFSYAVPEGSLWWFGDTFRGTRDETGRPHFAGGGVSCAVGMLAESDKRSPPRLDFLLCAEGTVAQAVEFLPGESWDHHRIWPLSGVYVNGESYVYYSLIEIGKGTWDFRSVGSGLAHSAATLSVHERIQTGLGWRFPVAPTAVVVWGDWIYLYDVEKRGNRQGIWLSRVRSDEIEDPNAYEFWCREGPAFTSDKGKQTLLMKDVYGQVSVVWNDLLKSYVMATSSDIFHPREIRFRTARQPFGPWSQPVAGITVPEYRQGKKVQLVYCSYFHPELFREHGRMMNLTFSIHLEKAGFDANNEVVEIDVKSCQESRT